MVSFRAAVSNPSADRGPARLRTWAGSLMPSCFARQQINELDRLQTVFNRSSIRIWLLRNIPHGAPYSWGRSGHARPLPPDCATSASRSGCGHGVTSGKSQSNTTFTRYNVYQRERWRASCSNVPLNIVVRWADPRQVVLSVKAWNKPAMALYERRCPSARASRRTTPTEDLCAAYQTSRVMS
jgi:hypothetical protein